ncbi:hypothetical protein [Lichenibacterium dinghuense]|uniref:hypothetical protein n=1 Tax=Lichenibacterium dinghuense TaxID=2895977 RepID=UPI001F4823C2|nr:hypothetical protein [Lichenibacterium sp. 6Y81]
MKVEGRAIPAPVRQSQTRILLIALVLAGSVAGCATSPGATATCTDLISTGGGLLKFCQAGDKLHVTESGIDPAEAANEVKIVDDPSVLHSLQSEISPRPELKSSREIVARACLVKGKEYISIAAVDLKRIVSVREVRSADDVSAKVP